MCRAEEVGVGEGRALEREANVFAAELLMPSDAFFERRGSKGLAEAFRVSEEAMSWRLYNLGPGSRPE
jgi:Zn-dependent peptidase ImmA (M78 family)